MLLSKTNTFLKSKTLVGYIDISNVSITQGKQCVNGLRTCNHSYYTNIDTRRLVFTSYCNNKRVNRTDGLCTPTKENVSQRLSISRTFCSVHVPKDADVFGDLAHEKYERVEMDEEEEKEERYTENDAKVPKWRKLSPGQYSKLIKSHIEKGNLKLALGVLDLVKENRDQPNLYMYSLLIRAHAVQGDIKQCFKLYNKMKKRALLPNAAIYNSLINACAVSKDTTSALEHLHYLRQLFYEKSVVLNEIHYITLIKAYSWHHKVEAAFEIADEARDKGLVTSDLYACLFHAAISDEENGLKYALTLWHKMRINRVKPTVIHYNLLLRAIRDTKFGELKVNDTLLPGLPDTQIQLNATGKPDLLDHPPAVTTFFFVANQKQLQSKSGKFVSEDNELSETDEKLAVSSQSLNDVLQQNRLILFGGLEKLLNRMKSDNVTPDIKTTTLLLELIPPTVQAETYFLKYIEKLNIKVDITFYNILIKKRSNRNAYKEAKEVLYEVQKHHLTPNVITFGVLALGCTQLNDGMELLEQMNNIGYEVNTTILGTLIHRAAYHKDFRYLKFLMDYMLESEIKPSTFILDTLTKFERLILALLKKKTRYNRKELRTLEKDYNHFKLFYDEWNEKVQREDIAKLS
ncbi:pentatricopeptide repeat-containing protein 1, mitochondrial [Andrena cerasifolii]|uniref:pentatricopeptide repeat-containing protein 1, mitochondrial n=1 Tax=Andrena cerasifolii TaxID=2819439 RepID=UPI004037D96C